MLYHKNCLVLISLQFDELSTTLFFIDSNSDPTIAEHLVFVCTNTISSFCSFFFVCFFMKKTRRRTLTFRYDRKMRLYDFGVNFSNVVQVFIYVMPKYEHHSINIRWDTAKSKCRFSTLKTLPWRHQWRHHSQKVAVSSTHYCLCT